jgi:Integral membrane protein S linking to the trans Golgi network
LADRDDISTESLFVKASVMAPGGAGSQISAPGGSFYGREAFRPGMIAMQVALIQIFFYLTNVSILVTLDYMLGVPAFVRHGRTGAPIIFDQMLDHTALSLHTSPGLIAIAAFWFAAVIACPLAFIGLVGRSKSALDFSVTLGVAHLVCCGVYAGFPTTPLWWVLVVSCCAAMTIVCELWASRVEMRAIAVPNEDDFDQP